MFSAEKKWIKETVLDEDKVGFKKYWSGVFLPAKKENYEQLDISI